MNLRMGEIEIRVVEMPALKGTPIKAILGYPGKPEEAVYLIDSESNEREKHVQQHMEIDG